MSWLMVVKSEALNASVYHCTLVLLSMFFLLVVFLHVATYRIRSFILLLVYIILICAFHLVVDNY